MNDCRTILQALLLLAMICLAPRLPAAERVRVSYSALNASQSYLWVAQERGFYTKHGLEVELLYINSGFMNVAALVGGSVQVAGGGPVSVEARLRGIKLLILAKSLAIPGHEPGNTPRAQIGFGVKR